MTTYVALATKEGFKEDSDILLETLRSKPKESQTKPTIKMATEFISTLLDTFIYNFLDAVQVKPFVAKVVTQLGGLMQKTSDTLINKVMTKLHNKELLTMAEYFNDLSLEKDGVHYVAYPLNDKTAAKFHKCFEQIDAGNGEAVIRDFSKAMLELADSSLDYYMTKPMRMLRLGLIMSKMVDVATTTIHKAEHAAIKKIVSNMSQREMEDFASYLRTLLVEINDPALQLDNTKAIKQSA